MSGRCSRRCASRARLVRYGGDCYSYAQLALGHVDVVIDTGLQPYDIVAPMAVIEAAGGEVRGWNGKSAADRWLLAGQRLPRAGDRDQRARSVKPEVPTRYLRLRGS